MHLRGRLEAPGPGPKYGKDYGPEREEEQEHEQEHGHEEGDLAEDLDLPDLLARIIPVTPIDFIIMQSVGGPSMDGCIISTFPDLS